MNWLDSSSFTGLLSQAQKSIDKVLDISSEDASKSKKSGQSSEPGKGEIQSELAFLRVTKQYNQ